MSRITTSSASFSRARAAMRRACSREVRVCSCPWIACSQCIPDSRTVKPARLDELCDARRNEPVERISRGGTGPDVSRRGRIRLDLEEQDALGPGERLDDGVELGPGEAGPGGDRDPRPLEHLLRLAPVEELAELVGAHDEDRVVELLGAEELDRAGVRVEAHVVAGEGGP